MRGDFPGDQVAGDDAPGLAIDDHQVEHFHPWKHLHRPATDLPGQGLVGAQEQLLARLPARVKGPRNLRPAERAVGQQAAILAREGHALGHALVDDVGADLGQPIHVGLARPKISPLDRVVKEPIDTVAVVLVILGRVDAALRGDAVGAARTVLETEALDRVTQLGEGRRRRGPGQAAADHDDLVFAFVGRVDQLHLEPVPVPLGSQGARRDVCVQFHFP